MHWKHLSYCPIRKSIEERGWLLTTHLHGASERLMNLIGVDKKAFAETKQECCELRDQLVGFREELRSHRLDHRC